MAHEWLQSINVAINSSSLQNVRRDEFLFGLQDKADSMLCIIISYICVIRGQEKAFFIETFLKKLYLRIVANENTLEMYYRKLARDLYKIIKIYF